ncbi:MAG: TlpA family protein disulfide reductase, partial [Phycisphaeraceae bacterium]|nr:TlpA family protein disulfide reductase [Phycisphaeraceae bacterium]
MKLVTIIVAIACLTLAAVAIAQHAPALVGEQKPSRPMEVDTAIAIPQPNPDTRAADAPRTLTIGDPAPKPQLARIFKGDTDFKGPTPGKVTVMEFWATWCGPCKAGMPHLSELQEKYASKGVNIVGVTREKPEVVEAFLAQKQWDEKTRYTIALDLEDGTNKAYMNAAKRNGIPCAFVVDG